MFVYLASCMRASNAAAAARKEARVKGQLASQLASSVSHHPRRRVPAGSAAVWGQQLMDSERSAVSRVSSATDCECLCECACVHIGV